MTHPLNHLLTGVKCRATSVAKNEESYEKNCVKLGKSEESEERKWKRWDSKNDDMLTKEQRKVKVFCAMSERFYSFSGNPDNCAAVESYHSDLMLQTFYGRQECLKYAA